MPEQIIALSNEDYRQFKKLLAWSKNFRVTGKATFHNSEAGATLHVLEEHRVRDNNGGGTDYSGDGTWIEDPIDGGVITHIGPSEGEEKSLATYNTDTHVLNIKNPSFDTKGHYTGMDYMGINITIPTGGGGVYTGDGVYIQTPIAGNVITHINSASGTATLTLVNVATASGGTSDVSVKTLSLDSCKHVQGGTAETPDHFSILAPLSISSLTTNQVLTWNGSGWTNHSWSTSIPAGSGQYKVLQLDAGDSPIWDWVRGHA